METIPQNTQVGARNYAPLIGNASVPGQEAAWALAPSLLPLQTSRMYLLYPEKKTNNGHQNNTDVSFH